MATSAKVAVLGGGQLGRMLALSAVPLGIAVHVLDPAGEACSAADVAASAVKGDFKDAATVLAFIDSVKPDVLTVEIEHVDVAALQAVVRDRGIQVHPSPETIRIVQDKFLQKKHFSQHDLPVSPYWDIKSVEDVKEAAAQFGYPVMLKSKTLAYDGRGNAVVKGEEDIEAAMQAVVSKDVYVEAWVPFVKELAVMVARSRSGDVVSYPTVETIQKDSICHTVFAPAQIDGRIAKAARALSEAAVSTFSGAGVFGVELFLLADGTLLLNEIAPRVHNSGHYTIEACECCQFEQHIRAVTDLPLGSPTLKVGAAVMVNVLGNGSNEETMALIVKSMSTKGASVHWYNKGDARKGRKMGHITVVGPSMPDVLDLVGEFVTIKPPQLSPLIGIIMGSDSDLPTMKTAAEILTDFDVPFELTIVSAHRTPLRMVEYASTAHQRGLKVIIAGAGGAAHLPGMVASLTPLPVIGVPVALKHLDGVDSLHSIVQMPRGVPVATVAIDNPMNAALLAIRMLGSFVPSVQRQMLAYQTKIADEVEAKVERLAEVGWQNYKP